MRELVTASRLTAAVMTTMLGWTPGALPIMAQPAPPTVVRAVPPAPPRPRTILPPLRPVAELIKDLQATSFATRRRATRELYRAGPRAAVALGRAARGSQLEVAARAIGVLERMYTAGDLDVVASSEAELELLAESGPRGVSRRARTVLEAHTDLRQRRAVDQIIRLGGVFKDANDNIVNPNSSQLLGQPIITLQLGRGWTGGSDGLRFVKRLTRLRSLLIIDGVKATDQQLTSLTEAVPTLTVVRRGRALLGVKSFSMPCQIQEVRPGLAADKAGVKVGDIVRSFDGKPIADFQQLVDLIKLHKPGDRVPMTVERTIDGQKKTVALAVTLDSWEAASRLQKSPSGRRPGPPTEKP